MVMAALTMLVAPVAALAGPATAAQAVSCTSTANWYYGIPGVEAGTNFQWQAECTDGVAQVWNGVVTDPLCDGRAAKVWIQVWDRNPNGTYQLYATSPVWWANNGCGTSSSYSTWRPRSPGSEGWKLSVHLQACNGSVFNACSSERVTNEFG
jgi:hypothetical protein